MGPSKSQIFLLLDSRTTSTKNLCSVVEEFWLCCIQTFKIVAQKVGEKKKKATRPSSFLPMTFSRKNDRREVLRMSSQVRWEGVLLCYILECELIKSSWNFWTIISVLFRIGNYQPKFTIRQFKAGIPPRFFSVTLISNIYKW